MQKKFESPAAASGLGGRDISDEASAGVDVELFQKQLKLSGYTNPGPEADALWAQDVNWIQAQFGGNLLLHVGLLLKKWENTYNTPIPWSNVYFLGPDKESQALISRNLHIQYWSMPKLDATSLSLLVLRNKLFQEAST